MRLSHVLYALAAFAGVVAMALVAPSRAEPEDLLTATILACDEHSPEVACEAVPHLERLAAAERVVS